MKNLQLLTLLTILLANTSIIAGNQNDSRKHNLKLFGAAAFGAGFTAASTCIGSMLAIQVQRYIYTSRGMSNPMYLCKRSLFFFPSSQPLFIIGASAFIGSILAHTATMLAHSTTNKNSTLTQEMRFHKATAFASILAAPATAYLILGEPFTPICAMIGAAFGAAIGTDF